MIRPIICDPILLMKPSRPASFVDREVIQDMKDTLKANSHKCVGMAANMIGVHKNIIIIHTETGEDKVMINPVTVSQKAPMRRRRDACLFPACARPPATG